MERTVVSKCITVLFLCYTTCQVYAQSANETCGISLAYNKAVGLTPNKYTKNMYINV